MTQHERTLWELWERWNTLEVQLVALYVRHPSPDEADQYNAVRLKANAAREAYWEAVDATSREHILGTLDMIEYVPPAWDHATYPGWPCRA